MSLKSFHIFFIALSILLSVLCSAWAFWAGTMPEFAFACLGAAVGLVIYGVFFVRKARRIIT